ncbi:MAG: hypothetical protein C4289_04870 [Chloroflexota bacterium]
MNQGRAVNTALPWHWVEVRPAAGCSCPALPRDAAGDIRHVLRILRHLGADALPESGVLVIVGLELQAVPW